MKYENGQDIFPEKLLRQIQKYVSGKLVYIPAGKRKRNWGETSGYKQYLCERNLEIRRKFSSGTDMCELADQYGLSFESIKKIVYSKKEIIMLEYQRTLSSAQNYARHGRLEEWIHAYLLSDGHNKEFSDGLKLFDRFFIGPLKMPLALFCRCCGPEENMKWRVPEDWFERKVGELQQVVAREADMPPLIVNYVDGHFELNDGNHRFEAYKRLGVTEYYVIVWITERNDYEEFLTKYAVYLQNMSPEGALTSAGEGQETLPREE